ncbi:MAG: hypothetical protein ACRDZ5_06575, partial [Acidimicrobiales bacterium]
MAPPRVASCTRVDVPVGARAVIASDLFLEPTATKASAAAARELARALRAIEGGGVFVGAGNVFRFEDASPHEALEQAGGARRTVAFGARKGEARFGPDRALGAHDELR